MQKISLEECNCKCHTFPKMKHAGPCCYPCPSCGKNVKAAMFHKHVETCGKSPMAKRKR